MSLEIMPSDTALLDVLRRGNGFTIQQLATLLGVTATAVRQRLTRLMGQGLVERETNRLGRGRPSHRYLLTSAGRRTSGSNFADLAITLWGEIRGIQDAEVRRGLLTRIARRLAEQYADLICGDTREQKMASLIAIFEQRNVPFSLEKQGELPILTALACPYPDLAERDRGVCAMERLLFAELLGQDLRLGQCRLDGAACCTFEPSTGAVADRDGAQITPVTEHTGA